MLGINTGCKPHDPRRFQDRPITITWRHQTTRNQQNPKSGTGASNHNQDVRTLWSVEPKSQPMSLLTRQARQKECAQSRDCAYFLRSSAAQEQQRSEKWLSYDLLLQPWAISQEAIADCFLGYLIFDLPLTYPNPKNVISPSVDKSQLHGDCAKWRVSYCAWTLHDSPCIFEESCTE